MPALAPIVEKLEDVPEPVRQFYVQRDGKYHVELTGAPAGFAPAADVAAANGKLVEFRDNNILLKKQVDELLPLKTKLEGVDLDAAKAALDKVKELEKKGVKNTDDLQVVIAAAMKPLQDQLQLITTSAAEERRQKEELVLNSTIGDEFIKVGGEPAARDYIVSKAKSIFTIENGKLKAAPNQFSADRPSEPLSVSEWLTRQTKESAFAFKPSTGAGANPNPPGGVTRPAGQLILKDPTPQQLGEFASDIKAGKMRVENTNP
jgi:hypothetical protein